ncbi:tyrosine-type recombinase/integrase [Mycobacteroides abscessus]|uniref:tyrosine-type recombinase/integrase n=1 Tax=Mycobacteroides abscessus TaxID=36809 RepID=UPI000C25A4F5|nr:site-specific integrase [Mycobacteroides abscessus]RIS58099.1 site-specific integrase [Mycobacteroides abscessus]
MSRRQHGEGTIYRRKDGRYEAAAYLLTSSGRRKRVRVYSTTRSDAHTKLVAALHKADSGIPVPDTSWTIGGYLKYWLNDVAPTTRRPRTIELYESIIRRHLLPELGSVSLSRLTVTQLQHYLNAMLSNGHSVRTVQQTRTVLSAALTRAQREELVPRNVARIVELPGWQRKPIVPWTAAEANRFLAANERHPLYPAFLLLVIYGLRRGEVLGLRWTDINWDTNQIHLQQQLQQIGDSLQIGPIKTNAGVRTLPLLPLIRRVLSQHLARQTFDGFITDELSITTTTPFNSTDTEPENLVFLSSTGTPLWPRNFGRQFQAARAAAGVRRISLHHLRHTAATLLKNNGVSARDVQLILGHAHVSTTQQLYQHGDTEIQATALGSIEQLLLTVQPPAIQPHTSPHTKRALAAVVDSRHSRQKQPSKPLFVVGNTSFQSGGPGGARTLDTLLKRPALLGERDSLTSVITQLRTRTNTHILGYVAVRSSRQAQAA